MKSKNEEQAKRWLGVGRSCIRLICIGLILLSSIFLIRGKVKISAEDIAKLSMSHYDWSEEVATNLTGEQANTRVGFVLLLISFILQSIDLSLHKRWVDLGFDKRAVPISILVLAVVFIIGVFLSNKFQKRSYFQVKQIIQNIEKVKRSQNV